MNKYCCSAFERALEWGTDYGEDGPLIRHINHEYLVGSGLLPLYYCPWCGLDLEE